MHHNMRCKVCSYSKEDVLKIVAEHAGNNLPEDTPPGILRAGLKEDGSVEVFFLPEEKDSIQN